MPFLNTSLRLCRNLCTKTNSLKSLSLARKSVTTQRGYILKKSQLIKQLCKMPSVQRAYYHNNFGNGKRSRSRRADDGSGKFAQQNLTHSKQGVPEYWPQVPVIGTVKNIIFPKFSKIIEITDPDLMNMIREKIALNQPYAGVFLKRDLEDKSDRVKSLNDIYDTGTFIHIKVVEDLGDKLKLTVNSIRRIRITNHVGKQPFVDESAEIPSAPVAVIIADIENLNHVKFRQTNEIKALTQEVVKTIREIIARNPLSAELLEQILNQNQTIISDTVYLCDLGAALTSADPVDLQRVIEEPEIPERLRLTLGLLKQEIELSKLQERLSAEVEEKVKKIHKKFILTEQIKILKKELGVDVDDKDIIADKLLHQLKGKEVPKIVQDTINDEVKKLKLIEGFGSDFNVVRNYLDWLTSMPWGVQTVENSDIAKASNVLNAQHFGMPDIKNRILEFIAVSKLKGSTQGKILCFFGPPGVGKTSIARSIADSLNRAYFRFSVGGMTNVAEVKGHRRTYVGAMPGKLIQCLKTTQTENPLVLIDEIDKIGKSLEQGGGDPSSALLELLDPEQNRFYMDHYLDVPVDLSKVLFICTANAVDKIPSPLLDRMEVIEMSGYIDDEKLSIAKQYLIPKAMEESGLTPNNIYFDESSLKALVKHYCRESGVRNLQKQIEKIIRKIALKVVQKEVDQISLTGSNISQFLGKPIYSSDRLYNQTPPGVVMGLGYTQQGGTVLYVETSKKLMKESKDLKGQTLYLTGNLGTVMKESAETALTVAKHYLLSSHPDNEFLETNKIHIHVPKASQPKDGPSAGVTIVVALLSLALNKPTRQNIAMTGEITLSGKILPVGGIKEKTIAAKRTGVNCIILPEENKRDFEDIPKHITQGMEVHFVNDYKQVAQIVFDHE